MTRDIAFAEVSDRVFVLRHPVFDVSVTLVPGDAAALVVDTLSTTDQAVALAAAVRRVTPLPLILVNTHHHFDHCFGNAALADDPSRPVWAHEAAARLLRDDPDRVRREGYDAAVAIDPELAAEIAATPVLPPDRTVHQESEIDLGGRVVLLRHPGRGHTAGDLVVAVPDADVLVAGDLIEESGPPDFTDGYPLEWPDTLDALLASASPGTVLVPGHGAPLSPERARAQQADLAALAWLIRDGHADRQPAEAVAARAPFDAATALVAVRRGYAELAGDT
ncbi:MBL fold metallo-hydrolase [Plantactinospora sp. KBS50]|uniref:MBL fold metallo-hydrolase n=1 Tax=Plantactinospora sp. KBS50 TaxID=2024580 RepID=UPI000BAABADA|nr:MBL fold metallo-hydrolase [Plantactinospora sp. KBS50]ASW55869.1 MBL fold metallo-hydrolase [Plantactinospora sp. KBS50]